MEGGASSGTGGDYALAFSLDLLAFTGVFFLVEVFLFTFAAQAPRRSPPKQRGPTRLPPHHRPAGAQRLASGPV